MQWYYFYVSCFSTLNQCGPRQRAGIMAMTMRRRITLAHTPGTDESFRWHRLYETSNELHFVLRLTFLSILLVSVFLCLPSNAGRRMHHRGEFSLPKQSPLHIVLTLKVEKGIGCHQQEDVLTFYRSGLPLPAIMTDCFCGTWGRWKLFLQWTRHASIIYPPCTMPRNFDISIALMTSETQQKIEMTHYDDSGVKGWGISPNVTSRMMNEPVGLRDKSTRQDVCYCAGLSTPS